MTFVVVFVFCLFGLCEAQDRSERESEYATRLARLVEANVVATHAYQVLLAKRSGKGEAACYSPGRLSDAELEGLVAHQASLLKSDAAAVRATRRQSARGHAGVRPPSTPRRT
jgi:hypothetical protein